MLQTHSSDPKFLLDPAKSKPDKAQKPVELQSETDKTTQETIKKPTYFLALGVLAPTQSLYAESTQYQSRPSTFLCLYCLSPVQKYHKTFLQASPLCRETSQMMEEKVLSGHLSTDIPSEKLKKNRVTHPITYVHLDFIM